MKLAYFDHTLDISVRVYIDSITTGLNELGVELLPFDASITPPQVADVCWDPSLTGGTPPWWRLRASGKPVVATLHDGVPQLSTLPWEYYHDLKSAWRGLVGVAKRLVAWWRHWRRRCAALITPSEYARREAQRNMRLRGENIVPIYHGVDHDLFRPGNAPREGEPYLLHVSAYQPKKNFRRILAAYAALRSTDTPRLLAVVPGYSETATTPGIDIVRQALPQSELVPLYQNALGFLFPSLHESFGLPIVEAMACGCPVVTSDRNACAEIAGDAALLVNPRRVADLARAMRSLAQDGALRDRLRAAGLKRARSFTWRRSAESHLKVFEQALRAGC